MTETFQTWLFVALVIVIMYLWYKFTSVPKSAIEGFLSKSDADKLPQNIANLETSNTTLSTSVKQGANTLLIDTYRSDYENLIINLDEMLNQSIVAQAIVLSNKSTAMTPDPATIQNLANLQLAKQALDAGMSYIDSVKSTKSRTGIF
jgi:hypothetical protein